MLITIDVPINRWTLMSTSRRGGITKRLYQVGPIDWHLYLLLVRFELAAVVTHTVHATVEHDVGGTVVTVQAISGDASTPTTPLSGLGQQTTWETRQE